VSGVRVDQPLTAPSMTANRKRPGWWRWLDAVAVATILPSVVAGTARWWWIGDLCVHFRVFYAAALLLLAVIYLFLRRPRWLLAVSVVLGINLRLLWPLLAPQPSIDGIEPALTAMAANVFIGNTNPRPLLEAVDASQPDVLLLMEVDERWLQDVASLREEYPHTALAIRDEGFGEYGPFGLGIFSRSPLHGTRLHRLGTAKVPIIVTRLTHNEQTWTLIGAHPYPPVSAACSKARDTFLRELAQVVADLDGPKMLLGDLNVTLWSPNYDDLLRNSGLVDSQLGQGYQPTWPDVLGVSLIPIDHVLVSPEVAVLRRSIGPSIDSDHRPVIVEVGLRPTP
jgi:endonuclease/exonuclease/phosphatase (EEP) superfamily protein YafD